MDWAKAYRVEVFKALDPEMPDHKDIAMASYPVLVKEILGAATSWTPSTEEQLSRDETYVWYVHAIDESGSGVWSQGKFFRIEVALGLAPIEEALNETLEEHGVDREIIDDAIDNVRAKASGGTGGEIPAQISDGDPKASIQAGIEYSWKTKLGYLAGNSNTTTSGTANTYIGAFAGYSNVDGDYNTAVGSTAGYSVTGSENVFVGYNAGYNTTGNFNTMLGSQAGDSNTTGTRNTLIGRGAGQASTTATNNTFLGFNAGHVNTASANTFLGYEAGDSNTSGSGNTFVGYLSGQANTTAGNKTFLGYFAGYLNTASANTFLGYRAGDSNTSGTGNTFVGFNAGQTNTTYSNNTFVGYQAGYLNSGGAQNTFLGTSSGYANSTGYSNTFLGYASGDSNTNGYSNTFVGAYSGQETTTGDNNTFVGWQAGYNNSTGNSNTYYGYQAGRSGNGNSNTFLGYQAGQAITSGAGNIYVGYQAGYGNQNGINNVFIGNNTGNNNDFGSGNVFLGNQAGYNETGSNRLYIDNTNTGDPLIYGEFDNDYLTVHGRLGVGTKAPGYPMELETTGSNAAFVLQRTDGANNYVNATASFGNFGTVTNHPLGLAVNALHRMVLWTDNSLTMLNGASCTAGGTWVNSSSRDLKENITMLSVDEALTTLEGLNPVKYNYKADAEEDCIGFIAEEVPDLVATKDRKGMSPMDVVAVLTKVLQEQQKINAELRKEIAELKAQFKQDR